MSQNILSLYTNYQWLNRVNEGREYGATLPRLKKIAKEVGVKVSGKKKDVLLGETLHAVVGKIKKMTRRSPWTGTWPDLMVTADRAEVRKRIDHAALNQCTQLQWVNNAFFSSSKRPHGNLWHSGVPLRYAANVMYATNMNNTHTKTQRRLYFLLVTQDKKTVGFAECRFPPGTTAHLTLVCAPSGLGKLLITAVERISKGMGYSTVTVDPTNGSARVWRSKYGYRTQGEFLAKNLSNVTPLMNTHVRAIVSTLK